MRGHAKKQWASVRVKTDSRALLDQLYPGKRFHEQVNLLIQQYVGLCAAVQHANKTEAVNQSIDVLAEEHGLTTPGVDSTEVASDHQEEK